MQLKPHTTLFYVKKWKIVHQNYTIWKTIKFILNNIKFDIIIKIKFSTLWTLFSFQAVLIFVDVIALQNIGSKKKW